MPNSAQQPPFSSIHELPPAIFPRLVLAMSHLSTSKDDPVRAEWELQGRPDVWNWVAGAQARAPVKVRKVEGPT